MADLTIKDVRAKYPQYDDLSDQQLADSLHQRFYSDMDRSDFYGKIGLEASPAPGAEGFAAQAQSLEFAAPQPPRPDPRTAPVQPPIPGPPQPHAAPHDAIAALMAPPPVSTQGLAPAPAPNQNAPRPLFMDADSPWRDVPAPPDPTAGLEEAMMAPPERTQAPRQPIGDLGRRAARGLTEVGAAVPEAIAIAGPGDPYVAGAQMEQSRPEGQPRPADLSGEDRRQAFHADLARAADEMQTRSPQESAFYAGGDAIRKASEELFGAPDPQFDERFLSKLAEGAGNMAGFVGTTLLTGVLGGAMAGSALNTSGMYRRAKADGATEDQAKTAAYIGSIVGASEVVPIGRAFDMLPSATRSKVANALGKRLGNILATSGEEGVQEALAEIANNITEKFVWNEEQETFEGAGESALIGAILGGGMGVIAGPRGEGEPQRVVRDRGPDEAPSQPDDEPPAQPPQPSTTPDPEAGGQPQPPATQRDAPDLEAAMAPDPAPQVDQGPPPSSEGARFEVMDEIEMVDGEPVPTGGKVRVNLDTGEVSPVDPESAPDQREAVQSQPQEAPDVGTGDAPAAGGPETVATDQAPSNARETRLPPSDDSGRPGPVRTVLDHERTLQIEADPETFQYKGGGDTQGVTDRLQGVDRFDPVRAGQVILYERADGTLVAADGHQRTGLARRKAEEGQADVGGMTALIYRESEGYTPDDVMRIAALKNIGEGSGTAVDAARVLRAEKLSAQEMGLPPRSALVRDAEGIRRLSDDAFAMVANERASEQHAGIVGRVVEDTRLHANILDLLTRHPPENAAQAEIMARDAASASVEQTQDTLFGPETAAQPLFLERARILDGAIKELRKDRAAFNTVVRQAGALEGAGNRLDTDANSQRVQEDDRVMQYLQTQANRKGPISDALTEAARRLASGEQQLGAARSSFLESVKAGLADGGSRGEAGTRRGREGPDATDGPEAAGREGRSQGEVSPRQAEQTPEGEQTLIPGVEPVSDRERAEAAMNRPKTGRDEGSGSGREDLFGTPEDRRDLFEPQEEKSDGVARMRESVAAARETHSGPLDVDPVDYYRDLIDAQDAEGLLRDLSVAEGLDARARIADAWVLERGEATGDEHAVMLDASGLPVAVMSGSQSRVAFPKYLLRAMAAGDVAYGTHNHPNNSGFSADDVLMLAMGLKRVVAMGHAGARTDARRGSAMTETVDFETKAKQQETRDALLAVDEIVRQHIQRLLNRGEVTAEQASAAHSHIVTAVLDHHGVIDLTGNSRDIAKKEGFDVESIIDGTADRIGSGLRRAGLTVPKGRDRRDDQEDRRGREETRRPASGRRSGTGQPSQDPQGGDRGRRVQPVTEEQGVERGPDSDGLAESENFVTSQFDAAAERALFYSPAVRFVEGAKQKQATARDWKAILSKAPGVKKAELEWLGVEEWLDAHDGQISREALSEFLRENQIVVVEDRLAGGVSDWGSGAVPPNSIAAEIATQFDDDGMNFTDADGNDISDVAAERGTPDRDFAEDNGFDSAYRFPDSTYIVFQGDGWDVAGSAEVDADGEPRFENYTEEGGENYREVLLRVPNLHRTGKNSDKQPFVQSAHFEQENIVVHARIKDRRGPNGEKVLFVEEIQSDLASVWRENQEVTARRRELRDRAEEAQGRKIEAQRLLSDILMEASNGQMRGGQMLDGFIQEIAEAPPAKKDRVEGISFTFSSPQDAHIVARDFIRAKNEEAEISRELLALGTEKRIPEDTPESPFRDPHQYSLMVKRLLRMAAEEGYDRLSWTPGYMQAERWDNAAQSVVEGVKWRDGSANIAWAEKPFSRAVDLNMAGQDKVTVLVDDSGVIFDSTQELGTEIHGKRLSSLIGPNLADQIMSEPTGAVSGQKITFSDSGYAIAYDQHVRKAVDKIARKHGASVRVDKTLPDMVAAAPMRPREVGAGFDPSDRPVWTIDITDRLRAAALEPQPILQRFMPGATAVTPQAAKAMMPNLRAELDRLNLQRVRVRLDQRGEWQGAFVFSPFGPMDILIGQSADPTKTLYHEAIHAMRALDLFSEAEWGALRRKAADEWIEKYKIAERYPDLTREERVEEAIAEAFSDHATTKTPPKGSILIRAFNKIGRVMRAIRNAMGMAKRPTAEDVFGAALAGEIGARGAGNTGFVQNVQRATGIKEQALSAWGRQVFDLLRGKLKADADLRLGPVPEILRSFGGKGRDLQMAGSKLRKVLKKHRSIDPQDIIDLPDYLANPVMVLRNRGEDRTGDLLVVTDGATIDGGVIVAAISRAGRNSRGDEATVVVTVYAKDRIQDAVQSSESNGDVLYVRGEREGSGYRHTGANSLNASLSDTFRRLRADSRIRTPRTVFKGGNPPSGFKEQRQAYQPAPRGPGPLLGGPVHVPDRSVWDELSTAGAPVWDRIKGAGAAAHDALDHARFYIQDRFLPVLRAQQAIEAATGERLPENLDAYGIEETFAGRAGLALDDIDQNYTRPIVDIIAREDGLSVDMVAEWLTARHAEERNKRIAQINKEMPDNGSGMTNAEARRILKEMRGGPHREALERISDMLAQLRNETLARRVEAGLLTKDEADALKVMYKHYVPLKGFAETDNAEASLDVTGVGSKYSIRGPETRRALGRRSRAFNPLAAAITQAQEVAIRAEKNRVGQAVYRLATEYPSEKMWTVKNVEQKRFFNKTTGMVETRAANATEAMIGPDEMAVKIDGVEKRIKLHDPRLAEALGRVGADQISGLTAIMGAFNRYLSSMITMLDPEFVVRNAFRDFTAAQIQVGGLSDSRADARAIRKAMLKNWPRAWAAVAGGMKGKVDTEWQKHYRDFVESGAKVHFFRLENPEAGLRDLEHRVNIKSGPVWARAIKTATSPRALVSTRDNPVLGFVERVNLATENAVRLAAFVEARNRGASPQKAASLAKNLTVNFNRRGAAGSKINAWYIFFNAATQGLQVTTRVMSSKRGLKIIAAFATYGFVKELVNAALSEEDDDGILAYDKIPAYKRRMNDIWMTDGENAVTVPMPYIYAVFPYMGQQAARVTRGVATPSEAAIEVFIAALQQTSPLALTEGFGGLLPTVASLPNELATNENWLGRPIRPPMHYNDYGPNAYKFYPGVTEASKEVADMLNRATGGSASESGLIDLSPEYIDHTFGFLTAGAGKTFGRTVDVIAKIARGEEIEQRDIPIARQVSFKTEAWLDRSRFYENVEAISDAHKRAKLAAEAGERPSPRHQALASMNTEKNRLNKDLRNLNRKATALREMRSDLPRNQYKVRMERIEQAQQQLYNRLNRLVHRMDKTLRAKGL